VSIRGPNGFCPRRQRIGHNPRYTRELSRSRSYEQALDLAAGLWGIEPQFFDIWGKLHVTSVETKKAILRAMGVGVDTQEQIEQAIDSRRRREWTRSAPPCLVLSATGRPRQFPVQAPMAEADSPADVRILHEDGSLDHYQALLSDLPEAVFAEFDGVRYARKFVPLPEALPLGYYDVTVAIGGRRPESMRLILTPDRAYLPDDLHTAGVAISLYGVRSGRNWGCGDFRDLRDIVDWVVAETGAGFVGLNPLHAIHNRRPFNTSPYLPNSVCYQNFIYLDIEAIEDFQKSPRAKELWVSVQEKLAALRTAENVEYEQINALKLQFLKLAFAEARHARLGAAIHPEFQAYLDREGDSLDRFATYCALDEYLHRRDPDIWIWPDWPAPYRDPDSPQTAQFRKKHWRSVLFYKYVQWQTDRQLAAVQAYARERLPIGLYHDLALATDRCGSDLWAHRPFFVHGCRVGSPPDGFAPKGQDWAFPPPNADRHWETGYRLFTDSIRNNCRHGGALRIDHVMRFFRLYWIPDGVDATEGAYVRDRYEDLIRILALESVRRKVIVVGEDLGTVEPVVRETLARFGILSYRLFYFERRDNGEFRPFDEYPESALVSTTTHDLPTLAGFWINEDIEARHGLGLMDESGYRSQLAGRARDKQMMLDLLARLGLLPPDFPFNATDVPELTGELHNAIIGFLASTPSKLMLVNQEDLTKEVAQQNLPGTTWQYPNWSRKMKFSVEQLSTEKAARDFTAMFRHWLIRTGRIVPYVAKA
jgi:4-alpha-glucanotransferase